jgi:hypothetical protein
MKHSPTARAAVAALIAGLTGAACLLVATDGLASGDRRQRPEELQRLIGGLGVGPAVDLSRCPFSFDPRLCPDCPLNHGPVPGGACFCPQHACSILYHPPLVSRPWAPAKEEGDGRSY